MITAPLPRRLLARLLARSAGLVDNLAWALKVAAETLDPDPPGTTLTFDTTEIPAGAVVRAVHLSVVPPDTDPR